MAGRAGAAGRADATALLAIADVAAGALAALLLGALVDRWPKRRTMIATDLLRAAMLFTVPVMATAGVRSPSAGWWPSSRSTAR